jgi:hypothetical protein
LESLEKGVDTRYQKWGFSLWALICETFIFQASVTVPEVADIPDRQVSVQFKLQKVGEFELKSAFDAYCSRGSSVEKPSDQINALNIIISKYGRC